MAIKGSLQDAIFRFPNAFALTAWAPARPGEPFSGIKEIPTGKAAGGYNMEPLVLGRHGPGNVGKMGRDLLFRDTQGL